MAGAVHTQAYQELLAALVRLRKEAGLSQAALASTLGKRPSFVGKYELGERRLDMIETAVIVRTLGSDISAFWDGLKVELPEAL